MIGNFYFLTLPVKVHVDPSLIWWLANQNVVGTMSDTWHVHSRWVAKMMYTINCQSLRVGKCNKIVQRNIRQMMMRGGKRTQCPWWSNLVLESFCACKISKLTCIVLVYIVLLSCYVILNPHLSFYLCHFCIYCRFLSSQNTNYCSLLNHIALKIYHLNIHCTFNIISFNVQTTKDGWPCPLSSFNHHLY